MFFHDGGNVRIFCSLFSLLAKRFMGILTRSKSQPSHHDRVTLNLWDAHARLFSFQAGFVFWSKQFPF